MARERPADGNAESENGVVDRRSVLRAVGATAVAGVGMVDTASAHEATSDVICCGCRACGRGQAGVIVARPGGATNTEVRFTVHFDCCATPGDADPPGERRAKEKADPPTP
jgi:hypothetical protein